MSLVSVLVVVFVLYIAWIWGLYVQCDSISAMNHAKKIVPFVPLVLVYLFFSRLKQSIGIRHIIPFKQFCHLSQKSTVIMSCYAKVIDTNRVSATRMNFNEEIKETINRCNIVIDREMLLQKKMAEIKKAWTIDKKFHLIDETIDLLLIEVEDILRDYEELPAKPHIKFYKPIVYQLFLPHNDLYEVRIIRKGKGLTLRLIEGMLQEDKKSISAIKEKDYLQKAICAYLEPDRLSVIISSLEEYRRINDKSIHFISRILHETKYRAYLLEKVYSTRLPLLGINKDYIKYYDKGVMRDFIHILWKLTKTRSYRRSISSMSKTYFSAFSPTSILNNENHLEDLKALKNA